VSVQSQQGPVNLEGPKVPGTDTCRAGFGSVQTAGCAATAPPPDERQPERALLQRFRQNVLCRNGQKALTALVRDHDGPQRIFGVSLDFVRDDFAGRN